MQKEKDKRPLDYLSWKKQPLENVGVHSLTFFRTPMNMKCDSQASFLARTFASPHLCKPLSRLQAQG